MPIGAIEPRFAPPGLPVDDATRTTPLPKHAEPSPFATLLHGLGKQITDGESMMHGAVTAAHDIGPAELLTLQAGVYRYSEALDLTSRLIDHAASGLKTLLQGGGQ